MTHAFSGILVRFRSHKPEPICGCGSENTTPPSNTTTQQTETEPFEGDLHVNLWEIGKECFIDIGVMIENRDETSAVQIDVPWELKSKDVTDLGGRLNGEKSVAAVFNEIVHYDGYADGNFANIKFRRDNKDYHSFTLLRLNSKFFNIQPLYLNGDTQASQLIVKLPPYQTTEQSTKRVYIRLRLRRVPREVYTSVFHQKDRSLLSSSIETRIIDFRINVRRGVPDELLTTDDGVKFPRFGKIHCFLTTERSDDCVFQSTNFKGARSLVDEDIWNEYIRHDAKDGISKITSIRNYLGYQWTEAAKNKPYKGGEAPPPGVKDLVILGRFSKTTSGTSYIFRFLALALIFGTLGSALWDLLAPKEGQTMFTKITTIFDDGPNSIIARDILCAIGFLGFVAFLLFFPTWSKAKTMGSYLSEKINRSGKNDPR